eukprot:GFUD01039708.1.p1 GENE.GFUD01039708.1~~GFUD01039708.1.p1  ORF type:complete len:2472 (+),score=743.58 GFUD01039708.1:84-7418(+)
MVKPDDVYMVYSNRMVKPCKDSMETLVYLLDQFPVKDSVREGRGGGGVSRRQLLTWLSQESEQEVVKEQFGHITAKLLVKLVIKKEVSEDCEKDENVETFSKNVFEEFENCLLEVVLAKNLVVVQKESRKEKNERVQPVVLPDMMEAVQELFIQEAGEVLDRLNGSQSGKVVEAAISLARTVLCYLSGLQARLTGGGVGQLDLTITCKLATLVRHILAKVGEATEKVLSKWETRSGELLPILTEWINLMRGEGYSKDYIKFLHSKDTERTSLVSKLEWCVANICQSRDKPASQGVQTLQPQNGATQRNKPSRDNSPDPFDDFDDFSSTDSPGTVDADFELIDQADPAKERLDLEVASSCLAVLVTFSSPFSVVLDTSTMSGMQVRVVELVLALLDACEYNDASLGLVFPTCELLATGNMDKDMVVQLADMLKEMAGNCMTRTTFQYAGILQIARLLSLLAPAFHQHGDQYSRGVYLKLLQGLISQNYHCGLARLGPDIMVHLAMAVSELGRLEASWAIWSHHNKVAVLESPLLDIDTDEDQLIARCLPRFLASRSAYLRLTAARQLLHLASSSLMSLLKNILFPAIRASFQVETDPACAEDTKYSLAGSASALLASLTSLSPGLSRSVVSCLISLHSSQDLDRSQLARAVQLVADNRQQGQKEFVSDVLAGLLMDHFQDGGKLGNFPRNLLGYGEDQLDVFVRDHEGVIVPVALLQSPTENCLTQLSMMTAKQPAELIKLSFDKLAQLFLPGMAAKEFKLELEGKGKMSLLADFIHGKYPDDGFMNLVLKNLPSTMQQMFLNVNDPSALKSTFQVNKVEKVASNPPELSALLPTKVVELLQQVCEDDIWQSLCKKRPDSIVKIAVTLTSNLTSSTANIAGDRLRSLHSLYLWLDSIGPSINDQMLPVLPFLAQYLSNSLLNLVTPQKNSNLSITKSSLIVLQKLIKIITPVDSSSLLPVLFSINYCLVSIVIKTCPDDIISIAVDILEYLFVQNDFRFTTILSELEDYPDKPIFTNLQASLDKQDRSRDSSLSEFIARFLNILSTTDPVFLELPLKTLKTKLRSLSGQLLDLMKSTSVLRKLVCALVRIVKNKTVLVVSEALHCLGEIGPADLESQVLEFQNSLVTSFGQNHTVIVLDHLKDLLLSNDGLISRSAAQAITNILSYTEEGQKFLEPVGEEDPGLQRLKEMVLPFQKTKTKLSKSKDSTIDEDLFRTKVDDPNIWSQEETHSKWVTCLVHQMLSCFHERTVMSHLLDICQLSPRMCETVLPFIVHELLLFDSTEVRLILAAKFCKFFNDHFESVSLNANNRAGSPSKNEEVSPHLRKESLQVMLSVVSYLREQLLPDHLKSNLREENCWENNFWLASLNYLHCAQASLSCGAYFSAIQMCNIWCYERSFQMKSGKTEDHLEGNLIEDIAVQFEREGKVVQDIIYQANLNLGDKDGAIGAGKSRLTNPATRTAQLALEGKFEIALPLFDSQALSMDGPSRQGLVSSLYSSGMHYVLAQHLAGEKRDLEGGNMVDFQQECCWRLENWDQFSPEVANESFHGCVLGGLESAVRGDHGAVRFWKQAGEKIVAAGLSSSSLESSAGLYPFLSQLRQLAELERLAGTSHTQETFTACISHLVNRDEAACPDFLLLEPILTQRLLLLSSSKWTGGMLRSTVKTSLDKLCLHVSERARQAQLYWVCNQLQRFFSGVTFTSRLEEAMVVYGQNQKETGIFLAKKLLMEIDNSKHPTPEMDSLLPKVLFNLGNWLNQQKSEPSSKILDTYLVRTVQLLEATQNPDSISELTEAHMAVATFADQQHKQVTDFMDSTEFQERMEAIKRNLKEAEILNQAQKKQKTLSTARVLKERFSNLDTLELELYKTQSEEYLMTALKHYLCVLSHGDKTLAVYRLVSLWFSNSDSPSVQDLLSAELPSIPSHKFIPLLYQMAARMQVPKQGSHNFSATLFSLMRRCTEDHPHHAIPIALALANAREDERQEHGSKAVAEGTEDPRAEAAEKLVAQVEKIPGMEKQVKKYRVLSRALISLAYVPPPAKPGSSVAIPSDHHLLRISQWGEVAVPTDTLLVRPDRDYSGVGGIGKFSSTYSMVGGVNAPKKLSCTGTDGRKRLQLVKGKDDLRQDAVMEQVFGLMNSLLKQNEETRKNKLNVRTYKVVPLSQRSGILEWCENTQPIALYLVGPDNRSGAHKKFAPKDWDSVECRKKMAALSQKNARRPVTNKMKEQVFREVCSNFSPAMKFFFLEKFPSPGSYYLAQSAYTRSVATNSMVGHVLGLGDRHTNNILIDNSSGELVHIDLGVAFEQGKILPTPETIPFRLTRDIVDGFGPAGVEGIYRRCCERSMGVLRENKSAIMTVLEVLVHDPLYNWSVGPGKAAARQEAGQWEELQKETGQGNRMANRALLVLAAKLEGREEGAPLSVQGQVSTLIQKATDPANLCSVFEGWAAWC